MSYLYLFIFDLFKVDITKAVSIASLALIIYKTNYLDDKEIPIFNNKFYNLFKEGYFGGHTDLYIPDCNETFSVEQIKDKIKNNNKIFYTNKVYKNQILKRVE